MYLNDKSTGSVVGQQPFGGARLSGMLQSEKSKRSKNAVLSGTNDKAGGPHYMLKWASPQVIKETSVPLHEWRYPHME